MIMSQCFKDNILKLWKTIILISGIFLLLALFNTYRALEIPVKYCLIKQISPQNVIVVSIPDATFLKFTLEGKNLQSIDHIRFEVSSIDGLIKLTSCRFDKCKDIITLYPYLAPSVANRTQDVVPISLFRCQKTLLLIKLSCTAEKNLPIEAALYMEGLVLRHKYDKEFNPVMAPNIVNKL